LQCVAVCCSVLQCVAVRGRVYVGYSTISSLNMLFKQHIQGQHTATHCNTLQHTTECNTLQHTATHCNTLQPTATHCNMLFKQHIQGAHCGVPYIHSATHCNTLPHTATHCNTLLNARHYNTLQHTATHCDTLQHTATHCNTLQHTHPTSQVLHVFGELVVLELFFADVLVGSENLQKSAP